MILSLEVRLSLSCEGCDSGVPVNGPVPQVKCARCMEVTQLSGEHGWNKLLPGSLFVSAARSLKPGETLRPENKRVNLSATLRFPPCPTCGEAHDTRRAKLALVKGTPLTCKCGGQSVLQPVPSAFQACHPSVRGFVDAEVYEAADTGAAVSGGPVVMQCMKCQATLPVDGTKRLVECSYCTARNYLPDDLWLALHPAPKRESWFVLFDGGEVLDGLQR
ncbi:MAG: hypothetical protein JNJ54_06700 [Myxococcaceae bacterium]|nr:hypothetical protein [Myxococcaceae bacterium]